MKYLPILVLAAAALTGVTACKPAQPVKGSAVQDVEGTVQYGRTFTLSRVRRYELTVRTSSGKSVKVRVTRDAYRSCRYRGSRFPACMSS